MITIIIISKSCFEDKYISCPKHPDKHRVNVQSKFNIRDEENDDENNNNNNYIHNIVRSTEQGHV